MRAEVAQASALPRMGDIGGSTSFNFVLPHSMREDPNTQKDWRFCQRCFVLFYAGNPPGHVGACPAAGGGGHHPYGFNFVLPHTAQFYTPPVVTTPPPVQAPVI